jgi:hypothetical protein
LPRLVENDAADSGEDGDAIRVLQHYFEREKKKDKPDEKTEIREIDALSLSRELKKRWSYFIRKVYETDPLICPKCQVRCASSASSTSLR